MSRRFPEARLAERPVDEKTVAIMAYRAHRRRALGYTDVAVPVSYLERLLEIAAKAVKNDHQ